MKKYRLPIYEDGVPHEDGMESELIIYNEFGRILYWYIRSPHLGGLVEQDIAKVKEEWPKGWQKLLDLVLEDLSQKKMQEYNAMIPAKIESMIDQSLDDKLGDAS